MAKKVKHKAAKGSAPVSNYIIIPVAIVLAIIIAGVIYLASFANNSSETSGSRAAQTNLINQNPQSVTWDADFWNDQGPYSEPTHTTFIITDPMNIVMNYSNNAPPIPLNPVPNYYHDQVYGTMSFANPGVYTVSVGHDNGLKITLDGVVIYDHSNSPMPSSSTFKVAVTTAGNHMIKYEHNQQNGASYFHVTWSFTYAMPTITSH